MLRVLRKKENHVNVKQNSMGAKHPAKFSEVLLPLLYEELRLFPSVLDPFGGVGKLAKIKELGYKGTVTCNELEKEWVEASEYAVDDWHIGDAAKMAWAIDHQFSAVCTSPTYGNRMADHHNAKDGSRRITYRHYLGRPLTEGNTGKMQWGKEYRQKHIQIYHEIIRVLSYDGVLLVNVSNHIRGGVVIDVVSWHTSQLIGFGMTLVKDILVETPRMRYGKNGEQRCLQEYILVFRNTSYVSRIII